MTASTVKMTLRIAPKYWPRVFSFKVPSSAALSHSRRPFCSFSAILSMRSALPGKTMSYSRKLEGSGSGPEYCADKISSRTGYWGTSNVVPFCSLRIVLSFLCRSGFRIVVLNCFVHVPSDTVQIIPHLIAGIPGQVRRPTGCAEIFFNSSNSFITSFLVSR